MGEHDAGARVRHAHNYCAAAVEPRDTTAVQREHYLNRSTLTNCPSGEFDEGPVTAHVACRTSLAHLTWHRQIGANASFHTWSGTSFHGFTHLDPNYQCFAEPLHSFRATEQICIKVINISDLWGRSSYPSVKSAGTLGADTGRRKWLGPGCYPISSRTVCRASGRQQSGRASDPPLVLSPFLRACEQAGLLQMPTRSHS